jgi:diguanylate cyclase (GGDEF)-like protein/PAS domain S-box-containing protein
MQLDQGRDSTYGRDAERFRRAFDEAAIGMAIVSSDGRWLQVNQALADLTGYPQSELVGMGFQDVTHPDDLDADVEALRELIAGERRRYVAETRYFHADGRIVWVALSVSVVRDATGGVLYLISQMQDITERKQAEAKLAHQAMHDPLTGLPNRTLFNDRMLVAEARLRRGGSVALLFLDLDRFKVVNDGLGHDAGDRILIEAAARLRSVLRPSDTVARFGGDEFAVLCEGVDESGVEAIACRIAEVLAIPFRIDGRELSLSASTGIVLTTDADSDPDSLLGDADVAMYAAKQAGRARHVVFEHEMRGRRPGRFDRSGSPREPIRPAALSVGPASRS